MDGGGVTLQLQPRFLGQPSVSHCRHAVRSSESADSAITEVAEERKQPCKDTKGHYVSQRSAPLCSVGLSPSGRSRHCLDLSSGCSDCILEIRVCWPEQTNRGCRLSILNRPLKLQAPELRLSSLWRQQPLWSKKAQVLVSVPSCLRSA